MRKLFICSLPLLALTACFEEEVVSSEEAVRPVRTVEIDDLTNIHERYFVGTARAAGEVTLAFRVAGNVAGIKARVGDLVSQGDTVASLDPAPYQTEVDRLTADLASAQATFDNAKVQTDRQRSLVEKDVAAQATLDRFIAGESSAQAAIDSVQGALDKATLDLTYTQMKSPFDGRVVAKYVEDFEDVRAQEPVLRILNSDSIEMVVDIPERYISLVPYVEDISVTFDALDGIVLPAEVSEIGAEASSTTRTFPVTLLMEQPEGAMVLPGMAGRARGRLREGYEPFESILVPATAVFVPEGTNDPHVWLFDASSETVKAKAVVLGRPRTQGVSVKDGLALGDIVVTAGANTLREGQKVSLLAESAD